MKARERKAERDFLERSHELVTRNQQLARAIERRISAGDEWEIIPPPFGSRPPSYAATWCRQPALLPPSPLKWLSVGQSDLYPTAYAGPGYDEVSQIDNLLKLLVGHWDVTFTAVYLLPVILIALGFNLVASERESGLLQLALSQPVRASTILRAKATTVGITVLGTVGILYASATALASPDLSRDMLWRVTAAGLAILLYALFWLGLALMVNIWAGQQPEMHYP